MYIINIQLFITFSPISTLTITFHRFSDEKPLVGADAFNGILKNRKPFF